MFSILHVFDSMFSVTDFNQGKARQIFDKVKTSGIGVVVKNNKPECFLVSPEEFKSMMEMIENYEDLKLARQRIEKHDMSESLSAEEVFGDISAADLEELRDVEFE